MKRSMNTAAPMSAGDETVEPAVEPHSTTPHTKVANTTASLAVNSMNLRHYHGFWLPTLFLEGMAAAHSSFQPRPTDVILASLPKSGTTWLKALAFSTLNRGTHLPSDPDHPLHRRNPHDCVYFLEIGDAGGIHHEALPSPRLLASHMPYSMLPPAITVEGSGGRIVYVARDPKDVLVSAWLFRAKMAPATLQKIVGGKKPPLPTFEAAFDLLCEGRCAAGPPWRHALEYWEASRKRPQHVLFLRYEQMLRDPEDNLRKLAAFMGCPFSQSEEEAGVVQEIMELCSIETLKSLEVNRNGSSILGLKNESSFRKGVVGDWRNYMTPDMAARLDRIVEEALQGSGLTFGDTVSYTRP